MSMNLSRNISAGDPWTYRHSRDTFACMSMAPPNWPCEPVRLFQRLGRVGLAVPFEVATPSIGVPSSDRSSHSHFAPNPNHIPNPNPSAVARRGRHDSLFLPPIHCSPRCSFPSATWNRNQNPNAVMCSVYLDTHSSRVRVRVRFRYELNMKLPSSPRSKP